MKELIVPGLDEKDEEFADILVNIGLKRNVAKTLVYLANVDEATSRHIEMGAYLRQPEVSIAMRKLMEKNWVDVRDIKKKGKGRPLKCYKLAFSVQDIISNLEDMKRMQAENDLKNIRKLRDMCSSQFKS
ncbi:MAG: ArsR family transcriptional regulator [Methanocellales archaeon]|nr:ArsR family transcriptional regulator [Methanocellales archaeon]